MTLAVAQNGKGGITVRQLLSHQAGLAALDEPISKQALADPDLGIGYAYTPNLMGFGSPTDPREVALRSALYRSVGGRPQQPRPRRTDVDASQ